MGHKHRKDPPAVLANDNVEMTPPPHPRVVISNADEAPRGAIGRGCLGKNSHRFYTAKAMELVKCENGFWNHISRQHDGLANNNELCEKANDKLRISFTSRKQHFHLLLGGLLFCFCSVG